MRTSMLCSVGGILGLALALGSPARSDAAELPFFGRLFKPDLQIVEMTSGNSRVYIRVANSGLADAKACSLRLWQVRDGDIVASRLIPVAPLERGQSRWIIVDFGNASLAHSILYARIDCFNAIAEADEADNLAVRVTR